MSDQSVKTIPTIYRCSFCGLSNLELKGAMIAGAGVCICQECVMECVKIVFENNAKSEHQKRSQL